MLDSSLVEMDLYQFIEQVRSETKWNESDRNSITIFKSDAMRIILMGLHKKASLKSHKANGVISVQVLEGKINFETDRQQVILEPGQMIALHENIMHSVDALEESFFLLTLSLNKSNTK
ncbi:MAG: cupin domain-containing protein [Saprospiraceae bacterium]|nr:cupin domain-containing protein [Saprospiraceae bacterium]